MEVQGWDGSARACMNQNRNVDETRLHLIPLMMVWVWEKVVFQVQGLHKAKARYHALVTIKTANRLQLPLKLCSGYETNWSRRIFFVGPSL